LIVVFLTALVLYAVVPLWGAWRVRRTWNQFRYTVLHAMESPEVDFSLLQATLPIRGTVKLTGRLEAFEGADRLWIGNDRVSIPVSLRGVPVYFIDDTPDPFAVGTDPPRRADAESLGALPEGTQFLICGQLDRDLHGQPLFVSTSEHRLLVLAFEGDPTNVLTRAVFSGRSSIDLWNSWVPVSVGIGFLLFLILAYAELRSGGPRASGIIALALALLPATFFLPPGILFYYGFSRLWSVARDQRAWIDLSRTSSGRVQSERLEARRQAFWNEVMALFLLGIGLLANTLILVALLRLWIP